jgi:5'-nucleotidase
VLVCAPAQEQSAMGRAMTMTRPLRLCRADVPGMQPDAWCVDGTPADSVKLAVSILFGGKAPDLLVSGINWGANTGTDIHYSGTVSAAMEGALLPTRSYAVSLHHKDADADHDAVAALAVRLISDTMQWQMPFGTLMNINIPAGEPIGVCCAAQGLLRYHESYVKRTDPRGGDYYWLTGSLQAPAPDDCTDYAQLKRGYVTITPIQYDMTDRTLLQDWSSQTIGIAQQQHHQP